MAVRKDLAVALDETTSVEAAGDDLVRYPRHQHARLRLVMGDRPHVAQSGAARGGRRDRPLRGDQPLSEALRQAQPRQRLHGEERAQAVLLAEHGAVARDLAQQAQQGVFHLLVDAATKARFELPTQPTKPVQHIRRQDKADPRGRGQA